MRHFDETFWSDICHSSSELAAIGPASSWLRQNQSRTLSRRLVVSSLLKRDFQTKWICDWNFLSLKSIVQAMRKKTWYGGSQFLTWKTSKSDYKTSWTVKKIEQEARNFWKGCRMKDIILLNAHKKFREIRLVNEALGQTYSYRGDERSSETPRPCLQTAVCLKPGWWRTARSRRGYCPSR